LEVSFLLKSFSHVWRLVDSRLESALARQGLSIAKLGVLSVLSQADEPLPLSQVAGQLACVRSNVTQLIDRMETDGLVRRIPNPDDRRSIQATITEMGRRQYAIGLEEQERVGRELFEGILSEEQEQLHSILRRISSHLDQEKL
jgi:DNA-binding MarR family transcriptional regulator